MTQTHSFSLNLMMAAILYWAILNSAILDSAILLKTLIPTNSIWLKVIHSDSSWWRQPSWIQPFCTKETSLIDSDSMWWWQPSWILPTWIQPYCTKLWLNLIQSDSNSFILNELDDGSHIEFCHLGFRHLFFFSRIHSKTLSLHSDSDSN